MLKNMVNSHRMGGKNGLYMEGSIHNQGGCWEGQIPIEIQGWQSAEKVVQWSTTKEYHSPTATEEDKGKKEKEEQDKGTEGNDGKTTTKDQHTKQDPIDLTSEFVKHRCETLLASRLLRRIYRYIEYGIQVQ